MRDKIVALLRAAGAVRRVDAATMMWVKSFFADRVEVELAAGARQHPLGFLMAFDPLGDGLCLRYHVWPPGWAVPPGQKTGQTHDHSYELNSLVVAGSLRQRTFQAVLDIRGEYDVLEVDYTSESSLLRPTGQRARLNGERDETFSAGTAYRLGRGIVHRIETLERPSASVVLTVGASDAPAPRVFVPSGQAPPVEFIRGRLDAAECANARGAISALRAAVRRCD